MLRWAVKVLAAVVTGLAVGFALGRLLGWALTGPR
jgi:hypothetical protein